MFQLFFCFYFCFFSNHFVIRIVILLQYSFILNEFLQFLQVLKLMKLTAFTCQHCRPYQNFAILLDASVLNDPQLGYQTSLRGSTLLDVNTNETLNDCWTVSNNSKVQEVGKWIFLQTDRAWAYMPNTQIIQNIYASYTMWEVVIFPYSTILIFALCWSVCYSVSLPLVARDVDAPSIASP